MSWLQCSSAAAVVVVVAVGTENYRGRFPCSLWEVEEKLCSRKQEVELEQEKLDDLVLLHHVQCQVSGLLTR